MIPLQCIDDLRSDLHGKLLMAILVCIALLITRALIGVNLVRPIYMALIMMALPGEEDGAGKLFGSIVCYLLIVLNLIIDALNHTDFCYQSENPFSESLNLNKFVHGLGLFWLMLSDLIWQKN